jgi:surfeit locus 1 family protein
MKRWVLGAVGVAIIVALLTLGTWQIERLAWKRALIAQVEARLAAAPVPAPSLAVNGDAYLRVTASGTFEQNRDSFVQASTTLGPGFWVLTPLHRVDGPSILINRGFVAKRLTLPPTAGEVAIKGLLRLSEPGGGYLRRNDPGTDRWYSRDIAAIAARRGLHGAANYFIDADRSAQPGPVGGLTVVRFPNNHLAYAITWYVLAAMAAAGLIYWWREDRHR